MGSLLFVIFVVTLLIWGWCGLKAGVMNYSKTKKTKFLLASAIYAIGLVASLGYLYYTRPSSPPIVDATVDATAAEIADPMLDFLSGKEVDFSKVSVYLSGDNLVSCINRFIEVYGKDLTDTQKLGAYKQLLHASLSDATIQLKLPDDFPIRLPVGDQPEKEPETAPQPQ